jgi:hypothetical protein
MPDNAALQTLGFKRSLKILNRAFEPLDFAGCGMPGALVPEPPQKIFKKLNLGLALGAGCRYKFVQTRR